MSDPQVDEQIEGSSKEREPIKMVVVRKFDARTNLFDRTVPETAFTAFDPDWVIISHCLLSENLQPQ